MLVANYAYVGESYWLALHIQRYGSGRVSRVSNRENLHIVDEGRNCRSLYVDADVMRAYRQVDLGDGRQCGAICVDVPVWRFQQFDLAGTGIEPQRIPSSSGRIETDRKSTRLN